MPKDIIIRGIEVENFSCFTDLFTYDFINGLTLICGINGKGKTSLMEALPYTFYGITSKGVEGDDVINRKSKKNCRTTVFFDIVNQGRLESYTLSRYRAHKKFGTTAILDGPVKAEGAREVKSKIESLILPQKLFLNTIFFGQKVKDFFTALPDGQKKDIFRKVLQLDDFIEYLKSGKKKHDTLHESLSNIDRDIMIIQSLIKERNERIQTLLEDKKKFINDKTQKIAVFNSEIQTLNDSISQKRLSIKKINCQYDENGVRVRISELNQELNNLLSTRQQEIDLIDTKKNLKSQELQLQARRETDKINTEMTSKLHKESKELTDKHQSLVKNESDLDNQIFKFSEQEKGLQRTKQSLEKEIGETEKAINSESPVCPKCGNLIDEDCKTKFVKEIEILKANLQVTNKEIELCSKAIKQARHNQKQIRNELLETSVKLEDISQSVENEKEEMHSSVTQRLRQANLKLDEMCKNLIEDIIKKYESKNLVLIEQINNLSKHLVTFEEIRSINKEIDDLLKLRDEKQLIISMTENQEFDDSQILSTKHQQKESQAQISILTKQLGEIMNRIEIVNFWRNGFSPNGIPSMLIDDSIPFMNNNISKYMDIISGGRYTVSFDTLGETKGGEIRDKIAIHFLDSITQNNCTATISGGQERIVDIATILTLNDLQTLMYDTRFNVLIFDEIFDSLDIENTEKISDLLKVISKDRSVNIISHTQVNQLEADRVLNMNSGTITI